jgi:HSP20 family molecular chaperone IbpA
MPQISVATALSMAELNRPAQTGFSNVLIKAVRGLWLPFRKLIAELRAFPVTSIRRKENLIIKAYLPGLQKDELRVEVSEDMLVIDADPKSDGPFLRAGRRLIRLPRGAKTRLAKAEFKNGILSVSLPMAYAKKHRHLPIECGDDTPCGSGR